MAKQKRGTRSILFDAPPILTAWASVAGKKESEGPLQAYFDYTNGDTYFGEKTWEKAESAMQKTVLQRALEKAELTPEDLDYILAGDLLNQCIGSSSACGTSGCPSTGSTVPAPPWESLCSWPQWPSPAALPTRRWP